MASAKDDGNLGADGTSSCERLLCLDEWSREFGRGSVATAHPSNDHSLLAFRDEGPKVSLTTLAPGLAMALSPLSRRLGRPFEACEEALPLFPLTTSTGRRVRRIAFPQVAPHFAFSARNAGLVGALVISDSWCRRHRLSDVAWRAEDERSLQKCPRSDQRMRRSVFGSGGKPWTKQQSN